MKNFRTDIAVAIVLSALIIILLVIMLHLVQARAQPILIADSVSRSVQSATMKKLPNVRWLAECTSWPVNRQDIIDAGGTIVWDWKQGDRAMALIKSEAAGKWGWGAMFRIGLRVDEWRVYSAYTPNALKVIAAGNTERCRWVGTWSEAWAQMTSGQKDWLKARVTNCGEATIYGSTWIEWPGSWNADATGVTLDGLGPSVTFKRESACSHVP